MRGSGDTLLSYPFMTLNGNKETVTLNLKSETGREVLRGLARRADVLLELFAPGTLDRHGVGARALTAINPRLIFAAGTGFGRTGPHRDYPAMDLPVDVLNRGMWKHVVECGHDQPLLEWATRMVLVSRALERVGDQAVDIGEQVAFLMTGDHHEFTRYTG